MKKMKRNRIVRGKASKLHAKQVNLKKVGIMAGAVVGGVIGGSISLAGKLAKQPTVDDIGESVVNSSVLTGELVGNAASGAVHMVNGAVAHKPKTLEKGVFELKKTGGKLVDNMVTNVKIVAKESSEIVGAAREKNPEKVKRKVKKLGKMLVVQLLTVGALDMKKDDEEEFKTDHQQKKGNKGQDNIGYEPSK